MKTAKAFKKELKDLLEKYDAELNVINTYKNITENDKDYFRIAVTWKSKRENDKLIELFTHFDLPSRINKSNVVNEVTSD